VREGQVLSSQIVSGEAERLDVMGTEQADVVLSELLTDVVNKLDLSKLFLRALRKARQVFSGSVFR
jgi:hypothetical protein